MDKFSITVIKEFEITQEDIDDIMCSALEGGINYWCNRAKVIGKYLGEYASEQISRGGSLVLYDAEDDKRYMLNIHNLLNGIKKAIAENYYSEYEWVVGNKIDTCQVDACVADVIIQLALFDDVIYG